MFSLKKTKMKLHKRLLLSSMSVPRREANWQQTAKNYFMSLSSLHLQHSCDQTCVLRVEPYRSRSFTKAWAGRKLLPTFVVECIRARMECEWSGKIAIREQREFRTSGIALLRNNSKNATCLVTFFQQKLVIFVNTINFQQKSSPQSKMWAMCFCSVGYDLYRSHELVASCRDKTSTNKTRVCEVQGVQHEYLFGIRITRRKVTNVHTWS